MAAWRAMAARRRRESLLARADRADCKNAFDELKNQWGWGGLTTHDLAHCRLAARIVALVYGTPSLDVAARRQWNYRCGHTAVTVNSQETA